MIDKTDGSFAALIIKHNLMSILSLQCQDRRQGEVYRRGSARLVAALHSSDDTGRNYFLMDDEFLPRNLPDEVTPPPPGLVPQID